MPDSRGDSSTEYNFNQNLTASVQNQHSNSRVKAAVRSYFFTIFGSGEKSFNFMGHNPAEES